MLAVQELMAVMRVQALIDLQICTLVAIANTHLDSDHAPRKAISELIALFPSMSSLWRVGLNCMYAWLYGALTRIRLWIAAKRRPGVGGVSASAYVPTRPRLCALLGHLN